MLTLEATLAAAGRQRLERMVAQVDLIAGSVASAEILAHDVPTEHKEIDVRDSLDEAWLAFEAEADRHGLDFVNDIPGDMKLMLDPYAFLTVVRNLMRNAAEHAAPAPLRVTCLAAHSLALDRTSVV